MDGFYFLQFAGCGTTDLEKGNRYHPSETLHTLTRSSGVPSVSSVAARYHPQLSLHTFLLYVLAPNHSNPFLLLLLSSFLSSYSVSSAPLYRLTLRSLRVLLQFTFLIVITAQLLTSCLKFSSQLFKQALELRPSVPLLQPHTSFNPRETVVAAPPLHTTSTPRKSQGTSPPQQHPRWPRYKK